MKYLVSVFAFLCFAASAHAAGKCAFGEAYSDASEKGFKVVKKHKNAWKIRGKMYRVSDLQDEETKIKYRVFTTFRDEDDGGNTIGWIEDLGTGKRVAKIGDSELVSCYVYAGARCSARAAQAVLDFEKIIWKGPNNRIENVLTPKKVKDRVDGLPAQLYRVITTDHQSGSAQYEAVLVPKLQCAVRSVALTHVE